MKLRRIVSGGQTGADQGGLVAANRLGIDTGGWAPTGWITETGPDRELLCDLYGLVECEGGYELRTELNVRDSDATVIFARDVDSDGTRLTLECAQQLGKPVIVNPTAGELREFVEQRNVVVLNVAGNRESVAPGIAEETQRVLVEAFAEPKGGDDTLKAP